ncbi:MAG: hypothetical protein LW865_17970 [Betaproteobacteria bacterium]|nr:hypothetical protein [Betaproteobacteria bacterium]
MTTVTAEAITDQVKALADERRQSFDKTKAMVKESEESMVTLTLAAVESQTKMWIDEALNAVGVEDNAIPTRVYRGFWDTKTRYSKGDIVTDSGGLFIALKETTADLFDVESWQMMLSAPKFARGGGGAGVGGGTGGGWPTPVLSTLDMNSFAIVNLRPPVSALDAATKDYVDKNGGNISKAAVSTAQLLSFAGGSDGDLLDVVAVSPTANQIIAWNAATKKWESQDNNAAAVIKHFAATAISGAGTAGQTAEQILLAQYATLAGSAARAGVFAVIENGAGNDGKFNGVYYFDGTNWTKFARELSASGAGGLVKALVTDPDPNLITTPQPLGTAQYTVENNAKEIKVVDGAGNWNTIYSETNIRTLIAQSRSFKGTVVEKGATVVGTSPLDVLPATTALTATDVGTYYVFVGTGGHVILANEIGGSVSNVDGTVLSPGDWIQVANLGTIVTPKYDYVVIHGDALSMARARAVFGLNLWADGAFERGSIVRYQPTPNAGIHYYVASGDVVVGDTAPGATPPPAQAQPRLP